jgi:nucleotide-binding universal stress UspA family protein
MTAAFSRVLVPLDGSSLAEQALPVGAAIARKAGAALHLVTVIEPAPVMVLPAELPVPLEPIEPAATVELSDYLQLIAGATREAQQREPTTAVLHGGAAASLGLYVRERTIDLVVMTTHARKGLSRWWLGSVADSLVRQLRVPVLLLHPRELPQPTEFRRILVALNGELDQPVLEAATALGRLDPPARYLLLHVVEPPIPVLSPLAAYPAHLPPPGDERVEAAAHKAVDAAADRLRAEGHVAEPKVIVGRGVPDRVIEPAAAFGADVIVVGTHAPHGLERALLGSVAERIVHGTSLPVLVVPVPRVPA